MTMTTSVDRGKLRSPATAQHAAAASTITCLSFPSLLTPPAAATPPFGCTVTIFSGVVAGQWGQLPENVLLKVLNLGLTIHHFGGIWGQN